MGRAVSRTAFDAALVQAAITAGAFFLPECQAVLGGAGDRQRRVLLQQRYDEYEIRAKVVIGADGLAGTLRRNAPELAAPPEPDSYLGAGAMTAAPPSFYQPGTIYMAYSRFGYVGLVRVENERLAIAAAFAKSFVKKAGTLAQAAGEVLREAGLPAPTDLHDLPWKGTPELTRRPAKMSDRRFFALGDATGYVEPFTGEGLAWAMHSAAALIPLALRGVAHWSPQLEVEWTRVYRQTVGRRQTLCRVIARALRHPALIETIFRLVEKHWLPLEPLVNFLHLEPGSKEPAALRSAAITSPI